MKNDRSSKILKSLSVRLDDAALSKILDDLDHDSLQYATKKKRADQRYPYRHKTIVVELIMGGGEPRCFRVPSRDLSRSGISFLHGGYVHAGTRGHIQLVTIHNNWQTVEGTVVRCQYIEGRIHEVGLRFDQPIDVAAYASGAVPRRVLVVDDEPSTRRLIAHHLEQMNGQTALAENGEDALKKAKSQIFDLILMDVEMPVMDGLAAVKKLRENGYHGTIVATTALTAPGDRERLIEAGFNGYAAKPITKEVLEEVMKSMNDEPLFSTLSGDGGMKELINQFVSDLAGRIRSLEDAAAHHNLADAERLARALKGEAGAYGFEPITVAAQKAEDAAKAAVDLDELKARVDELTDLCRLARPMSS